MIYTISQMAFKKGIIIFFYTKKAVFKLKQTVNRADSKCRTFRRRALARELFQKNRFKTHIRP